MSIMLRAKPGILITVLLLLTSCNGLAPFEVQSSNQHPDNLLTTLTTRLITHPSSYVAIASSVPNEIHVGRIPEKLPLAVTLPKDAQVLGTVRAESDKYTLVHIVLESDQDPKSAVDSYAQSLRIAGLRLVDAPGQSGFVEAFAAAYHTFCNADSTLALVVPYFYTHLRVHEYPQHLVCLLLLVKN